MGRMRRGEGCGWERGVDEHFHSLNALRSSTNFPLLDEYPPRKMYTFDYILHSSATISIPPAHHN